MTTKDIQILGITNHGNLILGGFFTAHDTHGYHCDWFMTMFLNAGFEVSIPYFACECLQHLDKYPDMIWPMLESAYSEARQPFNAQQEKERLNIYLALRWTQMGKPSLQELSLALMDEYKENGRAFIGWLSSIRKVIDSMPKRS